jgi:hypothetical protein
MHAHEFTQEINRAWLGDSFFTTRGYQDQFVCDNSCTSVEYKDEEEGNEPILTYGIIWRMYKFVLGPDLPTRVVIFGDWYDAGTVDTDGLLQIRYNPNFESEDCTFLSMCRPENYAIWPKDPFSFDFGSRAAYRNTDTVFKVVPRSIYY